MIPETMQGISFDGHCDTIQKMIVRELSASSFMEGNHALHVDLVKATAGNLCGAFMAIQINDPAEKADDFPSAELLQRMWNKPMTKAVGKSLDLQFVARETRRCFDFVDALVQRYSGHMADKEAATGNATDGSFRLILRGADVPTTFQEGVFTALLHIEGADGLDGSFSELDYYIERGVRSIAPVWSRPNLFGSGVPIGFPGSPERGDGLTQAGKDLVRACEGRGILVDCAHMTARGFRDVAGITQKPLIVTHTAVHRLCASARNLTDSQIDAVGASGGVIGIAFFPGFLRSDGLWHTETGGIADIVRHIRYVAERIGIEHVALGSDFDGARMPDDLPHAAKLPLLCHELAAAGFHQDEIACVLHRNWFRLIRAILGDSRN